MPEELISRLIREVSKCSNCGLCQTACPVFRVTGRELGVARGRNQAIKALAEGELEWDSRIRHVLFQCLGCRACEPHCFPSIPTHRVVARARAIYVGKNGGPDILHALFNDILPHPSRMNALMKAASLGQRTRLDRLLPALKIFGWFSRSLGTLARSSSLFPPLPKKPLRESIEANGRKSKTAYFIGCGINYMMPDTGKDTLKLMEMMNNGSGQDNKPVILDNLCCGLPAYSYGYESEAIKLAKRNINIILDSGAETIVTECASCSSFLKDYPELLQDDPEYSSLAKEVSGRIKDLSEWLPQDKWPESREKITTTFHEPCHLGRFQGLAEKPKAVLKAVANTGYIEMKEADWCCGGAGSYNVSERELSMKVLDRKMQNIKDTDADVLITECPACMVQLAYGLKTQKLEKPRLMHLSSFLASLF